MRVLSSVAPTPEQLKILGDVGPGFRLIRGAAGSGKTTTAILRLKEHSRVRLRRRARHGLSDPVRVLVLTFNRTLEGYIAELARQNVPEDPNLILEVSTFSRWARSLVDDIDILDRDQAAAMLRPRLRAIGVKADLQDFMIEEAEYLLSRFPVDQLDEYEDTKRTGRGSSPQVRATLRRQLLDEVVKPYQADKAARGVADWNDLALEATAMASDLLYDVVIVDEAQDFSANQVRAVLAHLRQDHSTTFVLDAVQRIYPRFFTWSEVGISVRPHEIHRLSRNYRNTAEIAAFARPLVEGLPLEDDGTLPDFDACDEHGRLPEVVIGKYSEQLGYMLDEVLPGAQEGGESVAILQPRAGRWFDAARSELHRRQVPFCELTRANQWPGGDEIVGLSTMYSAKGLEFDHVLLPGLSQQVTPHGEGEGDSNLEQLRRMLAMAIGRARKSVMLGYKPKEESSLIHLLEEGTFKVVRP